MSLFCLWTTCATSYNRVSLCFIPSTSVLLDGSPTAKFGGSIAFVLVAIINHKKRVLHSEWMSFTHTALLSFSTFFSNLAVRDVEGLYNPISFGGLTKILSEQYQEDRMEMKFLWGSPLFVPIKGIFIETLGSLPGLDQSLRSNNEMMGLRWSLSNRLIDAAGRSRQLNRGINYLLKILATPMETGFSRGSLITIWLGHKADIWECRLSVSWDSTSKHWFGPNRHMENFAIGWFQSAWWKKNLLWHAWIRSLYLYLSLGSQFERVNPRRFFTFVKFLHAPFEDCSFLLKAWTRDFGKLSRLF